MGRAARRLRCTLAVTGITCASALATDPLIVDPTTLNGKIVAGYQGWFSCPGDDGGGGWGHWSRSGSDIGPGLYTIEMWPDLTAFDPEELFLAPHVTLLDSSIGQLFSSRVLKTVERHFRWMR